MKETIDGKIKGINIGEEKAVIKVEVSPTWLKNTDITYLIGKDDISITFDDHQSTLDENQTTLEETGDEQ
ncbi:MAG TPA: hypothetical protein ENI53_01525 [Thermoplasmatales archaeon]|nr:hypothetical protein [Thermoplasmatales archaeon]